MKNSKLFQYVFIGAFVFFIIIGAVMFATYRSTSQQDVQINISMWGTLPGDSFSTFISQYFADNDLKYTVNYEEKDPATFDRELVEALASGDGPDAIILPTDLIVRYTNKVYPIPYAVLPELTFKQTFIQEGEMYLTPAGILALPLMVDPLVMYWNRDTFNNVSVTKPPVTWAEISGLVPKMTKKDQAQNILSSTVALGEFRNVANAKEILSALLVQAGGDIIRRDENGQFMSVLGDDFDLKESPSSLALSFYAGFSNPSKSQYSWNRSLPNSQDVFTNGDLAMYFGFASEFTTIKEKNPNLNFDVALLPQVSGAKTLSTFGNMLGLAILKNSADPAGAFTVLTSLTSAQAVPFWSRYFALPSARRDVLGQTEASAIKTVFNQSAIMSKGWFDPNRSESTQIFQEMVESYTTGRGSLDQAVSNASGRLNNLLK